jgi:imidazolonepropionase-like amidohydrolase
MRIPLLTPVLAWLVTAPQAEAQATRQARAGGRAYAVVDVNVVPMDTDRTLPHQTVLVRDGRIAWVGPSSSARIPADVERIDGRGKFLLPGLADLHVHLSRGREELDAYLYWGVTTVLDLASRRSDQDSLLALRDALRVNARRGPTLFLAGPSIDGDPPVNAPFSDVVPDPDSARRLVHERARRGYDVLKVYNNLSPATFSAILEAAGVEGLSVVGHIPRDVGAETAIAFGQAMVAHGEEFFFTYFGGPRRTANLDRKWRPDTTRVAELVRLLRSGGTWVMPNLSFIEMTRRQIVAFDSVLRDPEVQRLPAQVLAGWRAADPRRRNDIDAFAWRDSVKYQLVLLLTRRLQQAGVPLLAGTDAIAPGMFPGASLHLELELLVRAGLTPYEALVTATRSAGEFATRHLRSAKPFGLVAVGYGADLVLLERDPRVDIANTKAIVGVMRHGSWYRRQDLGASGTGR